MSEVNKEKEDELLDDNKGGTGVDTGLDDSNKDDLKKKEEKTFTQEEVNRMMAREKKQGRAALLKELGYEDEKTAINASKSYNAWLEAQKSDEQKAADKESANNKALKEAQAKAELSEAKVEAMMLGCQPAYVEDVIALAVAKKTDDGNFKTIIGDLKKKYPIWFGEASDDEEEKKKEEKKKEGQKGTGGSVGKSKEKKEEEQSLGTRLAAARRVKSDKKSFWS